MLNRGAELTANPRAEYCLTCPWLIQDTYGGVQRNQCADCAEAARNLKKEGAALRAIGERGRAKHVTLFRALPLTLSQ
jgi:hypothetical protein